MKKLFSILLLVTLLAMAVLPVACTVKEPEDPVAKVEGEFSYKTNAEMNNTDYNKNLYYLNDLKFEIADPDVLYIEQGEEAGWFYAYGTSDLVGCFGIQCWRSKDLTNWEYKGVAYQPDFATYWDVYNHWAPEILYDAELDGYLLFYNADNINRGGEKRIDVAFSQNPYGPFVPFKKGTEPAYDFTANNPQIDKSLARSMAIDVHPYIDPVTGDKYLYYSGYGTDGNGKWHNQTIFGVKLINWTTPDYSTLKELTKLFNTTTDRSDDDIDEGRGTAWVNEAAYVYYHNDTYYLTFSVYAYDQPMYQVRQAVADSPLGDFRKIQPEDGGQIIATDEAWSGVISSAGHHCFIECGDQLMIAYHTFLNRSDIGDGRALAVDTISFVENSKGETVLHANGPTYSYQPLPSEISGYENIAPKAKITVNNTAEESKVDYLTDGQIKIHAIDPVKEFETSGGNTVITLEFDKFVNARSILLYNSTDYDKAIWGINSIKLHYKTGDDTTDVATIKNVLFDDEWNTDTFSEIVYPGANIIAEFDELPVNKIEITINAMADTVYAINEIMVLGKEVNNPKAVTKFVEYTYEEPTFGNPLPVYESHTFGNAGNFTSSYGYDLSHDDGTENAYVEKTWCGDIQELFFKDVVSTTLYVEAELSVLDHTIPFKGNKYPKIGLKMNATNNYFTFFNIDCQADYTGQKVGWVESAADGGGYKWQEYDPRLKNVGTLNYTGDKYTKLAIARIGSKVWLFVNDTLAFDLTHGEMSGFTDSENSACGISFLTYDSYTRFRNYSITDNLDEVRTKLASLGVNVG